MNRCFMRALAAYVVLFSLLPALLSAEKQKAEKVPGNAKWVFSDKALTEYLDFEKFSYDPDLREVTVTFTCKPDFIGYPESAMLAGRYIDFTFYDKDMDKLKLVRAEWQQMGNLLGVQKGDEVPVKFELPNNKVISKATKVIARLRAIPEPTPNSDP